MGVGSGLVTHIVEILVLVCVKGGGGEGPEQTEKYGYE